MLKLLNVFQSLLLTHLGFGIPYVLQQNLFQSIVSVF